MGREDGRRRGENLAAGTERRDSQQHGREQTGEKNIVGIPEAYAPPPCGGPISVLTCVQTISANCILFKGTANSLLLLVCVNTVVFFRAGQQLLLLSRQQMLLCGEVASSETIAEQKVTLPSGRQWATTVTQSHIFTAFVAKAN